MAKRNQRGSRLGNVLVLVGLLTIGGLIFGAGVYTGRRWPSTPAVAGAPPARTTAEHGRAERGRVQDPPVGPTLTFYQELTAPLTAPPPARTPKKPVAPPVAPPEPAASDAPRAGEQPPTPAKSDAGGAPFTVQVGAYRARPPAEALRASLAAAGHDARVIEIDGAAAVRYRVRVGAFATREAARDAAARLASERSLSTFVTAR
ncbi:MAG TPA: SPOR domain-containing protein [Methylomirabilota bacterium]|jgi:cell division protein FtsN|nr:SPOR domain-containing protein [Methylomirabilota bacterium]HEV8614909.1 SPOR domain-containing protein [Methylomirabilota bacterium]